MAELTADGTLFGLQLTAAVSSKLKSHASFEPVVTIDIVEDKINKKGR